MTSWLTVNYSGFVKKRWDKIIEWRYTIWNASQPVNF